MCLCVSVYARVCVCVCVYACMFVCVWDLKFLQVIAELYCTDLELT